MVTLFIRSAQEYYFRDQYV